MSRNRSHEPPKPVEEMIPVSAYNSLVKSFQEKLVALEVKYQGFVSHCTKIIKEAQSLLDQSINEHILSTNGYSSKIIESLTQQKAKLNKDLISIEKMSIDFESNPIQSFTSKISGTIKRATEKILSKIEDLRARSYFQSVLHDAEGKILRFVRKLENRQNYKERVIELENAFRRKEKEYDDLQEHFLKLKAESHQTPAQFGYLTDFKDKRLGSPTSRGSLSGRTSPGLNREFLHLAQIKDQEISKLKSEIGFLKESLDSVTKKAQSMIARKEDEVQRNINDKVRISNIKAILKTSLFMWDQCEERVVLKLGMLSSAFKMLEIKMNKLKGNRKQAKIGKAEEKLNQNVIRELEKTVSELKNECDGKSEEIKHLKDVISRANKQGSELFEKNQALNIQIQDLSEKGSIIKELKSKLNELTTENTRLNNYKIELDTEINELKEFFQVDIDNLSNKIEKLFGENLSLRQKNEEIKEKYEKVMSDKEKLLTSLYENSIKEASSESSHSNRTENIKPQSNPALALKQELKISNFRLESLQKDFNSQNSKVSNLLSSFIGKFELDLSEFFQFSTKNLQTLSEKLQTSTQTLQNFSKRIQILSFKLSEVQRSYSKLSIAHAKLNERCNQYQDSLEEYREQCEKLDSVNKCPNCDLFHKQISEKEQIISSLQHVINNLERENVKLDKDLQNGEFTFQNHGHDTRNFSKNEEKSKKSRAMTNSNDLIKTFDSKIFETTGSEVELTYTLEGTTIKSNEDHDDISENDEINELYII